VLQQKYSTAPAEKERSRCILISKTSKKLLCDEQETKKTNKKRRNESEGQRTYSSETQTNAIKCLKLSDENCNKLI
jgi:hypothetical protein